MKRRVQGLACLLGILLPAVSLARTLDWEELAVTARLDAEGRLHVQESQAMVFDGAWNGGEREFRLAADQSIELHGVTRIDLQTGSAVELQGGSLNWVDHYDWTDRKTLRWRSRMPSDPEFDNETIIYVLDYTLSGVIQRTWRGYVLDHDFAFPDRYGMIERFTLDLEIDPAWHPKEELAEHHEFANLPPGLGYVVTARLDFTGSGRPSGIFVAPPFLLRLALIGAALAVIVVLFLRFQSFEREQGRFELPDMPQDPYRAWIEEHLLSMRPEEVGALWDRLVAAPEVSAVLARLVAEGKLASRVEKVASKWKKDILHLELLVDREELGSYERKLVDKLFFGGRTETSTQAVKEHYKSKGFSPASAIRAKLERRLERIAGFGKTEPAPAKKRGLLMLAVLAALLGLEALTRGALVGPLAATLALATVVPAIIGYIGANWRQRKADNLLGPTLLFLIPLGFILAGLYLPVLFGQLIVPIQVNLSWFGMAALLLLGVVVANSFFNNARTRDSKEAVRHRKRLAAIRRYFQSELKKPDPNLEDGWFPYLLAFGLAGEVDKWAVAFPQAAGVSTSRSGSFSGGSSSGGWSGGGGSFGGAGASAGWAAAATGLAAGVAAPSSSGGGGGGGGGGGSSGGGGGGGW
jgi:uncharacterized membrane protein YgcG